MYVLGISCFYHDASAALLKDGKIVAAVQEERFTRKKHDISFPKNAIEYCLKSQNISIKDIDYIGFYEKPLLKFERVLYQHLEIFPKSYKTFIKNIPLWFNEKLRVLKFIRKLGYNKSVFFIHHHMTHAASFLLSPFRKAAILTIDGVGEWTTTAYGNMNKTNPYYEKLNQVIDVKNDGSFRLDMSYFVYHYGNKMPSKKLCNLLGGKIRKSNEEITQRHKDIAAALQLITEEVIIKILSYLYKETKSEKIVLSGGVALNSVANGKILKNTPFKNIWIQPDPGDGGTSIGAAVYVYNTILGNKRDYVLEDAYLGPEYSDFEIKRFLDDNKIKYYYFKNSQELVKEIVDLIYKNKVVGWFQGKMEWGPRALGARSILANPCNPEAKELLNVKVKHREKFRPFAPVVCREDVSKYFECDKPIPLTTDFMLMVHPIKKKWHSKIPSVVHVDGSGRLQTVTKEQNPLYYNLIKEFGKVSKIPILINTSFNIRGEPIVCSQYDAYRCMMGTEIDYLVIGNFLISRIDNLKDAWNSEKYAKD